MENANLDPNEYLNLVSFKMSEVRRKAGEDFPAFRKLYFKHYHKRPDADFHKEICGLLGRMHKTPGTRLAIAAPRGSAKTTLLQAYAVYCIVNQKKKFILIISNTAPQAESFLSAIKAELETNSRLLSDFPEVCEFGKKPGPPRWRQHEIITRNKIRVLAIGTGQQMRGVKYREHRPDLIIMDDLEADESTLNPETRDKLQNWVNKTVLKAGTDGTDIICAGTIHHYDSFLAQLTSPDYFREWKKKVYKSVISWSERPELWEKWGKIYHHEEEFGGKGGPDAARKFFEHHKNSMLKGTKVLWSQNKGYYDLMVMREEDPVSFDSEMQNDPVNPRDCLFNLNDVRYWDQRFGSEEELFTSLDDYSVYGACDPSLGRKNRGGDFSAIVSVVRDSKTGTIYVLDADISRRHPDKTIDAILAYNQRRKYSTFAFEANNFQELMAKQLRERSEAEGSYLNLEEIKNTTDKKARIESLQPMVKNGTIQFSKRLIMLLDQMKYFPKGAHDDGLDALQMAVQLCSNGGGDAFMMATWDCGPQRR